MWREGITFDVMRFLVLHSRGVMFTCSPLICIVYQDHATDSYIVYSWWYDKFCFFFYPGLLQFNYGTCA